MGRMVGSKTMTYQKQKLEELIKILMIKGRNKPGFKEIKSEMIDKLGWVVWERLFRRAQVRAVIRDGVRESIREEHGKN